MKNTIKFYEKGSVEILYAESNHSFPLHSHESFCVGAVTKGSALFTINDTKCLLDKSMAFIIPSNTGISITSDFDYSYVTVCFKNELKEQVKDINFNKYFIKMDSVENMLVLFDIFKENKDEIQLLDSILDLISSSIDSNSLLKRSTNNEIVLSICEYIKKNAIKKFNLDDLARSFHLSKYHLIRIFKKEMGVTPNQYYIQSKMRIIKSEVFKVKSKVDLAANLNLADESHLHKMFKKQMGISLQDYKENITKL